MYARVYCLYHTVLSSIYMLLDDKKYVLWNPYKAIFACSLKSVLIFRIIYLPFILLNYALFTFKLSQLLPLMQNHCSMQLMYSRCGKLRRVKV